MSPEEHAVWSRIMSGDAHSLQRGAEVNHQAVKVSQASDIQSACQAEGLDGGPVSGRKAPGAFSSAAQEANGSAEDFIDFPMPGPKDKRAKKPSPKDMSDEEYAAAWENHRQYLHELDVYKKFEYIHKDFQFIVGCFSELYGEELFNYLRVNQDNHELRKRFVLTLDAACASPSTPSSLSRRSRRDEMSWRGVPGTLPLTLGGRRIMT